VARIQTKPFFSNFWMASLVNLLFACGLAAISFLDVIIAPVSQWVVGEPAPTTYRAEVTRTSAADELISVLDGKEPAIQRFIVRRGEIVNEADLEDLRRFVPDRDQIDPKRAGGVLAFYFLALTFFNLILRRSRQHLLMRLRSVLSVYLALLISVLATRLLLNYTTVSLYAAPIMLTAILFAPLISQNIAFIVHLLALALIAPMIGVSRGAVLVPLVSGWTAILLLDRESGPVRMFLAASAGALVGGLFLIGLDLFVPQGVDFSLQFESDLVGVVGATLVSGLLAGLLIYPATRLFGAVSPTTLRRLLEMDRPLLKDLSDKAPGTFQHSLAMANMAEKVADDIGANAELVRAGAYYHDIGKMHLPDFFSENQQGDNPHDSITPEESVEKLRSHVEAGVTIAKGADLPERIIDFIIEHHGRSTMEFFMDKAFQLTQKVPAQEKFRYNGRNPTSRETAILMIVDSIEAASRTLKDPSQDDIENLVRRIIFSKLLHGYLDGSGLTTGDLKQTGISLIKFLQAQFHVRVMYPWQKKENQRPPLQVVDDTHAGVLNGRVAQPVEQPAAQEQAEPPAKGQPESSEEK
jgi:cyclic-di-AMP phosphodiesterase PgpH